MQSKLSWILAWICLSAMLGCGKDAPAPPAAGGGGSVGPKQVQVDKAAAITANLAKLNP